MKNASDSQGDGLNQAMLRLQALARDAAPEVPWQQTVRDLQAGLEEKPREERFQGVIAALQAVRDSKAIDAIEAQLLIAQAIIGIVEHRLTSEPEPALESVLERMRRITWAHGLEEGESWALGEGPPEWEALIHEYEEIWDGIVANSFNEFGEAALGADFLSGSGRFDLVSESIALRTRRRY